MVRKIFRILDSQKKLEFHPCETNLTIGGCLVGSFRPPFWFCIHFVGLPQPFVVHRSWSVQPTDSVQYQVLYIQPNYVSILSLLSQLQIFADDKKQLLSILKYTSSPCLKIHLASKYLKPIKRLHFRYLSRVLHLGSALQDTTKNTPAKSQKKNIPFKSKKKKKDTLRLHRRSSSSSEERPPKSEIQKPCHDQRHRYKMDERVCCWQDPNRSTITTAWVPIWEGRESVKQQWWRQMTQTCGGNREVLCWVVFLVTKTHGLHRLERERERERERALTRQERERRDNKN